MTFCAVLSEPVFVYVPVAIYAALMCYPPEHLGFLSVSARCRVTFGTRHCPVFTPQPEGGVVMAESRCRTESVESMAGNTVGTQGFLVVVLMACRARSSESQVGAGAFL